MKNKDLQKTKFNLSWISSLVIFIGCILYIPLLHYTKKETRIIYYRVPLETPSVSFNQPGEIKEDVKEVKPETPVAETPKSSLITKNLKLGDIDPEVKILQQYLNKKGFLIAASGPGSPGQETEKFGAGTKEALIKFQEANAEILLTPFGLKEGTGIVGDLTKKLINS